MDAIHRFNVSNSLWYVTRRSAVGQETYQQKGTIATEGCRMTPPGSTLLVP